VPDAAQLPGAGKRCLSRLETFITHRRVSGSDTARRDVLQILPARIRSIVPALQRRFQYRAARFLILSSRPMSDSVFDKIPTIRRTSQ
jgi:hypothetical protein